MPADDTEQRECNPLRAPAGPRVGEELLEANRDLNGQLRAAVADSDEMRQAGFMHDAQKEYAEACITFALIQGTAVPGAGDVGVPMPAYLNGLGETVGELRRFILDSLRRGDMSRCETLLDTMDDIYGVLMSMDYPDTVTHGLRRNSDAARGLIERTRGDLTNALRQDALEARLRSSRSASVDKTKCCA